MSELISLLNRSPFTLIAALPESSVAFAKAALESGADAIMVELDPSDKDKSELIDLVRAVNIPVGISFTEDLDVSEAQLNGLKKLGFDFFDININKMTGWMQKADGIGRMVTLGSDFAVEDLTRLGERAIEGIDAAIIPKDLIGSELNVGDLQQYITIALSTGLPVVVPTQKLIRVSEVPVIWDTGAKGLLLENNLCGSTMESFRAVIKEFKSAVVSIKEE